MNNWNISHIFSISFILVLVSCTNSDHILKLRLGQVDPGMEIDTIQAFPEKRIFLLNLVHNYTFGRFSTNYAVAKDRGTEGKILYILNSPSDLDGRISKRYIAYVKSAGKVNWGWFRMENGNLVENIPGMNKLLDSLRDASPKGSFIKEINGYISIYMDGKTIKKINYGQLIAANSRCEFDSLEYGLYQLNCDSLRLKSNNPDDLFTQSSGTYFIPPPGYGIVARYDKIALLNMVDSASRKASPPASITIPVFANLILSIGAEKDKYNQLDFRF